MWFGFQGIMRHTAYKNKDPQLKLLEPLLIFFAISIWYNQKNQPDAIGIMCKNCKK